MRSLLPAQLAYESLFEPITRKGAERTPALRALLEDLRAAHSITARAEAPRRRKPAARVLSRAAAGS